MRERPWDLLLVTAALLILIAVGRVHSFVPGADAIRPAFIVTIVALLALLARHGGPRAPKRLAQPLGYLMAFLFVWAIVGLPFSIYPGNSVGFLLENFLRTGVVVVVIAASVRNAQDMERLLRVYAIGAIVFSVGATGAGGFRDFEAGGYDPNDSAMFVVAAIPLVLHFLIRSRSTRVRVFYAFGLLACGSAVVLSGSRGGFLALVAVLGYCLFFFRSITPAMRVGAVAAIVAIVGVQATAEFWNRMETIVDEEDYNRHSVTGRVELWSRGMGYMAGNPVFGVGIANFSVAEGRHPVIVDRISRGLGTRYSAPHSIWVQAGAELGIPGLVALLGIFGYSIRFLWRLGGARRGRSRHPDPEQRKLGDLGTPLIGLLIGIGVAGTFLTHAYTGLTWGAFALVLALVKLVALRERELRRPVRAAGRGGRAARRPRMHPSVPAPHASVPRPHPRVSQPHPGAPRAHPRVPWPGTGSGR